MISGIPFGVLVRQYIDEHGDTFGRTKSATLEALERDLGTVMVGDLDSDRWLQYVRRLLRSNRPNKTSVAVTELNTTDHISFTFSLVDRRT